MAAEHQTTAEQQCQVPRDRWTSWRCPNMKDDYEGLDGERYRCAICGESFWLDYEDMK